MNEVNNILIISPIHKREEVTARCVESIMLQVGGLPIKMIVCDNNSRSRPVTDTLSGLRSQYLDFEYVVNDDVNNYGPAKGNNMCMQRAAELGWEADLVVRVDNDTIFPTKFFARFAEYVNHHMAKVPGMYGFFTARPTEHDAYNKKVAGPLGPWYVNSSNKDVDYVYMKAAELTGCAPTLDGYHEWIYQKYGDPECHWVKFNAGLRPALYAWTQQSGGGLTFDERFTHNDHPPKYGMWEDDRVFMDAISKRGFYTVVFWDLYFHHHGSLTRELVKQ